MDNFTPKTYEIIPTETYNISRNCGGCGCKSIYSSTGKIRINANGKRLDVWLIYHCNKCKHTYNLPIYSRVDSSSIGKEEYNELLRNDETAIFRYGLDRNIFIRNGLTIMEPKYTLAAIKDNRNDKTINIRNPYHLSIRYDALLAYCMETTRTKVKKALETGQILMEQISDKDISFYFN